MLSGAYSKHYKTIERQNVETLKELSTQEKLDSIAKARKLSLETNRRRRALAVKRKVEAQKEEKRRKHILTKRREKQREATEKYQRCHIGSRPSSGSSGKSSPRLGETALDDALLLIRGSPHGTRAGSASPHGRGIGHKSPSDTQKEYGDPLNKPYFNKYASQHRASSPIERAQDHAREQKERDDLHNRSLRNLTSSRSLFERQLETHQQLLADQQKKSLREFNAAIMKEIHQDRKVQGLDEDNELDDHFIENSESLSSLDSLEGSDSTLQKSYDLTTYIDSFGQQQNGPLDIRLGSVPVSNISQIPNGEPLSLNNSENEQDKKFELSQRDDTLLGTSVNNTVDTGQKLADSVKNTETTIHAPNPPKMNTNELQKQVNMQQHIDMIMQQQSQSIQQQQQYQQKQEQQALVQNNGSLQNQEEKENFRPKVQMRAWATPSPVNQAHVQAVKSTAQNLVTKASPYSGRSTLTTVTTVTYYDKSRTPPVQAGVTPAVSHFNSIQKDTQSVPSQDKKQDMSHNVSNNYNHRGNVKTVTSAAEHNLEFLQTVTNGLNTVSDAVNTNAPDIIKQTPSTINSKVVPSHSPFYRASYASSSATRRQGNINGQTPDKVENTSKINGTVDQSSLGCVSGQLSVVSNGNGNHLHGDTEIIQGPVDPNAGENIDEDTDTISTINEEPIEVKEPKGILKKPGSKSDIMKKPRSAGNVKTGIRDSLEITRLNLHSQEEENADKPRKKNVRFADLCCNETEETEDSIGVLQEKLFVKTGKGVDAQKPPRPDSAKLGTASLGFNPGPERLRVASAESVRTSTIPRPKPHIVRPQAAAHIITQNSQIPAGGSGHAEDRKIVVVNSDFMEKVPAMLRAGNIGGVHSPGQPSSTQAVQLTGTTSYPHRGMEQKTTYAVSSIIMPKTVGAPLIMANGLSRQSTAPVSSATVPSQAGLNVRYEGTVYDDNGLRIDRTPTDDEINHLWENVRNCLSRNNHAGPAVSNSVNYTNNELQQPLFTSSRQAAPMSNKYIDGNALGQFTSLNRVAPNSQSHLQQHQTSIYGTNSLRRQNSSENANGTATKRYGLLHQRRQQQNPNSLKARNRLLAGKAQQYAVYQAPVPSYSDPQQSGVPPFLPTPEMSESMAAFLTAEQLAERSVSESSIHQAMEQAQIRQQVFNTLQPPQKVPSALSIEEQRLMESLDKLNEKLKITETTNTALNSTLPHHQQQQYVHVHTGGFRGHQPLISKQRRVIEAGPPPRGHINNNHISTILRADPI
ncbi:hypothetical protein CHS0354_013000 [Potamilus streckersoni]|uniref:Uncharacterized protein n=1 Tax=Potamilus streckersoni TaxID=2493646 RepID=A0AAE0W9H5_9BIVA|nr:hypothetical protein CHS0354_013000 [Potamilus streckersoni]